MNESCGQELRKFVSPEFVFGSEAISLVGRYVHNFGGEKVLVVSDPGVMKAGWTQKVVDELEREGLPWVLYSGASPNPKAGEVMRGAELYEHERCNLIVAVGGGSPMDCAKGIGIVSSNRRNILEFAGVDNIPLPGPPLLCVPTTAGSAADVSQFAIITDEERRRKVAIASKALVPDVSLIDPRTPLTLDPFLTAEIAFDALTHAFEAYVSNASSPVTDLFALRAADLVTGNLIAAARDKDDQQAHCLLMTGSLYAGLAFSNASLGAVHALGHSVGGVSDYAHGVCNLILLPYVVAFNFPAAPDRYRRLAGAMGLETAGRSDEEVGESLTGRIAWLQKEAGMPTRLRDTGISRDAIPDIAENALADICMVTNPRPMTREDVEHVYENAY